MQTFQEQQEFFNKHWPTMLEAFTSGGVEVAIDYLDTTFSDDLERRILFVFARNGMMGSDWPGRSLDDFIAVADAGIVECLRQAEAAPDAEKQGKLVNTANVISYNLGADLAFCWGDDFTRTEAHLNRGLKAGEDCLRWREELGSPPMTFSMAHWLIGIHHLALDDNEQALTSFKESLRYAEIAVKKDGGPTDLAGGNVMIVLGHGWVELTKVLMGDPAGRAAYDEVLSVFAKQIAGDDEQAGEDATFFVTQLKYTEQLLNKGSSS